MLEKLQNIVYDTNYTTIVPNGGFVVLPKNTLQSSGEAPKAEKKNSMAWMDSLLQKLGLAPAPKKPGEASETAKKPELPTEEQPQTDKQLALADQVKQLLQLPDAEYSDKKLTSELRQYIKEVDNRYSALLSDYKSHIAPSYREFTMQQFNVSGILGKCYYTQEYPSYIDALWTRDIMSMHAKRDMSFYLYPEDDSAIQSMLKQKSTQLKAELSDAMQKGITIDKEIEQQYRDVEMIREKLTTKEERYFELGNYTTIYDHNEEKLRETGKKFEQKISGYGIRVKNAIHRMDNGFTANLPICLDDMGIVRSAVTSSLAASFPFISSDLITKTGILYGVNAHTGGLVIFDRFNSKLPNMNSVILATSGAGKSFTVKLEILRYLLNGVDIIVIDPENEYQALCEKVGGTYVNIATSSQQFLNPFDMPPMIEDVEYGKGDLLRSQIMNLVGLIQILVGKLSPEEEALLDKALQNTYALKGFTFEMDDYSGKLPPLMEDLMNVLNGMQGGEQIALKLSKYVTGTFGKLFNNYTNIDINNALTVFSIRDVEEALKTPAMFNVLNFIWSKVRSVKKQRLLVCDEAWIMLQNDISANFLFGLIKRARKYGLGITTISQDIEDFIRSPYGKPIVSNSGMQILLKQSVTSIKSLNQLLGLSEAEQQRLVSVGVGEGLMFVGNQHVGVQILASPYEKSFITTDIKKSE
ncbi:MAG: VirB4-like conjugal transfer ATPase, CD1110 family [Candidatus Absconditicoccaceae bacterium]